MESSSSNSGTKTKSGRVKVDKKILIPVTLSFFVSGIVAMIGTVAYFVQHDFNMSDTAGSILASAIYIWYIIMGVPTGYIMNKLGHKNTVLLSQILTCISMVIPIIIYSYFSMIVSLCLLGLANAMLQVSLNLLVSDVTPKRDMSSMLTLGQFVGQIPTLAIPFLAMWSASLLGSWKWVYPLFLLISLGITYYLYKTKIPDMSSERDPSSLSDLFSLLKNKTILFCFIAIVCQVGIDIGISVVAPKILADRISVSEGGATMVLSFYALVRLGGCLLGAYLLALYSNKKIYMVSLIIILVSSVGLMFSATSILIYTFIGLVGLGISNLFAIIISQALEFLPRKKNDISVLMIMGLIGGAIFPPIMSIASNVVGIYQWGALLVMMICTGVMYYIRRIIKDE